MISQIATSSQCIMGYELDVIPFRRRYGLCANELPVSHRFYEFINGSLCLFLPPEDSFLWTRNASVKLEDGTRAVMYKQIGERIALWPKGISRNGA
ncbi:hypothetical protein CEXT_394251 [Caerostris extrusa]|uniref:Uncharacterized protein n=1 Tax=Caerostris extrusa TaxID=172846 RepID=A0AAV4XNF2_CAEEX|nr:hypothetical protein CEXT_394251 [Caerostris extrusa]